MSHVSSHVRRLGALGAFALLAGPTASPREAEIASDNIQNRRIMHGTLLVRRAKRGTHEHCYDCTSIPVARVVRCRG